MLATYPAKLSRSTVMEVYKDCFDKNIIFHAQLIDNPTSLIHPPHSVSVQI